jgi:hypothetical protein
MLSSYERRDFAILLYPGICGMGQRQESHARRHVIRKVVDYWFSIGAQLTFVPTVAKLSGHF